MFAFSGGLQQFRNDRNPRLFFCRVLIGECSSAGFSCVAATPGAAFSFFEYLLLAMLPLRLFGLMLPFDPLLETDIGSATVFSGIGIVSKDETFALEDERIGTLGTPSAGFPSGSEKAALSGFVSFAVFAADEDRSGRFDVADGVGEL